MVTRLKSAVFIDSMVFEFTEQTARSLRAVLIDELGIVCSSLEADVPNGSSHYHWEGLNDLPYGIYTLEYSNGHEEHRQRMVKRV